MRVKRIAHGDAPSFPQMARAMPSGDYRRNATGWYRGARKRWTEGKELLGEANFQLEAKMPFVKGRYYMNRVLGEALEGAREAEAALAALQAQEQDGDGGAASEKKGKERGPIQRLEIETAEMVPAHSGRGEAGYVARVHRKGVAARSAAEDDDGFASEESAQGQSGARRAGEQPHVETHAFNNHHDLVSFLRDELAKDHAE
jgi:hypothetical protein